MSRIIAPLSADERAGLIAAARSYLRTPFKHRGRSARGVDCLGLVVLSMRAIGREMQDREVYGRDPSNDGLHDAAVAHFGQPIFRAGDSLDALQPGDVVLMKWHTQPNHVGIVTDYPLGGVALIHSLLESREVIEHRLASPWDRRITEGFRA